MSFLPGRVEKAGVLDAAVCERVWVFISISRLTVGEFAERADLSAAAVTDLLAGRRSWLFTELVAAASAIGVMVSDLVDPILGGEMEGVYYG